MDIQILAQKFYDYSNYIKGYSSMTIRRYGVAIKYLRKYYGATCIEEITPQMIQRMFFEGRTTRNWKPQTFISYQKSLVVFFRWCVAQGYIPQNPAEGLELPKLEKRLPKNLTRKEALRLLEVVYNYPYDYPFLRYRNHAIFSTFVFAGLRKSELLHLKLTDVDIENLTIFVNQGKGSKDRIVPMSHTLAESLKRYLTDRKRLNKTCPEFFCSLNRNDGLKDIGLKWLTDKMRKASGISFTLHKLRHTFATLMLEGGCDIYSLSRMMGHSDIKTTTIYLYASAEHLRSQIMKHPLN